MCVNVCKYRSKMTQVHTQTETSEMTKRNDDMEREETPPEETK